MLSVQRNTAEEKFDGLHTAKRSGAVYSYHVTMSTTPEGVRWRARVVLGRQIVGTPFGFVAAPVSPDVKAQIEKTVQRHIEDRIGGR
jgi:hypothetical protein